MAEVTVTPRKKKGPRVERRGRFTITELEPDSPASYTTPPTPTFRSEYDVVNEVDDHESGVDGDVEAEEDDATTATAARAPSERISPFGSAVFEHTNGTNGESTASESHDAVACDMNGNVQASTIAAADTTAQPTRRVRRKGRFTIIELSSDSPRSPAEEFSNTTSISVTSTQISQANAHSAHTSPTMSGSYGHTDTHSAPPTPSALFARMVSEHNTMPTRTPRMSRTTRSMIERPRRSRESEDDLTGRRSTGGMRSVSPERDQDGVARHFSSSYSGTPSTPYRPQTFDPMQLNISPQMTPALSPSNGIPPFSLSSPYSSTTGVPSLSPTSSVEKRQAPELGANRRHLASRQKAITISAEQFIQQQHTIASLIRQQQELKQLIGILADQQHHLISMPKQLEDFRLDQTHSDAHEDSMREVQLQVGALSRANEALQQLLSEAEQDAHERTMEIECLSNENNELRYRFSNMEHRYREEKKRSMTLEQELQRTRRHLYLARKDKSDVQKYHQKLSSRGSSREIDDPVENQPHLAPAV